MASTTTWIAFQSKVPSLKARHENLHIYIVPYTKQKIVIDEDNDNLLKKNIVYRPTCKNILLLDDLDSERRKIINGN